MKRIIACISLALIFPVMVSAQTPVTHGKIPITATIEAIRFSHGGQVRQYLLWNRQESVRPIGHGFASCRFAPGNIGICTFIYSLPYGKIVTVGEVHNFAHFSAVITGGSRSKRATLAGQPGYTHIAGTLTSFRIGAGTYSLVFVLQP